MRSMFTVEEVSEMLDMKISEVSQEMENGHLSYTYHQGKRVITLYDLEKYMGSDITMAITREYLRSKTNAQA